MERADEMRARVYHVYPLAEAHLHVLDGCACLCDPKVERYSSGGILVVHNDKTGAAKKAN